jgi:hypothetical protein
LIQLVHRSKVDRTPRELIVTDDLGDRTVWGTMRDLFTHPAFLVLMTLNVIVGTVNWVVST